MTKLLQFKLKGKWQSSSATFLGKRWGTIEDFLSKTKNPRLRQDFGEQAHRPAPIYPDVVCRMFFDRGLSREPKAKRDLHR
jgi:hypothetical protein